MIHNHGAEEGPGLSCNELALPGGRRIGACMARVVPLSLDVDGKQIFVGDAEVDADGNLIKVLDDYWSYYRTGERVVIEGTSTPEVRHHSTERDVQPGAVPKQGTFHRRE